MNVPDYGACIEIVAGWIAAGAELVPGKTLVLEPGLPPAPDGCVALFETGGTWNVDRAFQVWSLTIVVRAARLADARALAMAAINAALDGYADPGEAGKGAILDLDLHSLPALIGRDDRDRVMLQAGLTMTIHAPTD